MKTGKKTGLRGLRLDDAAQPKLEWPGRDPAAKGRAFDPGEVDLVCDEALDLAGDGPSPSDYNLLIFGDNLAAMAAIGPRLERGIDLIYIDPPYATARQFGSAVRVDPGQEAPITVRRPAFSDRWRHGLASYLQVMEPRLRAMRDLLAPDGSLLVHVDWRVDSYLRVLLDEIFGADQLINQLSWCYGGGGAPKRHYGRKHDTILWYARGDRWTFNRQYRPYSEGTRQRGLTQVKGPRYALRQQGASLDDWWHGKEVQKILSPTAYENLKYPTQKPEGLMRRILLGHSNPGDLVADFYCGSGTTLGVAHELDRRWIGCDCGRAALATARRRLIQRHKVPRFQVLTARTGPGSGQRATAHGCRTAAWELIEQYGAEPAPGGSEPALGLTREHGVWVSGRDTPPTTEAVRHACQVCREQGRRILHLLMTDRPQEVFGRRTAWRGEHHGVNVVPILVQKAGDHTDFIEIPCVHYRATSVEGGGVRLELDGLTAGRVGLPDELRRLADRHSPSLALVDHWSVDPAFDGVTHRPQFFAGKTVKNQVNPVIYDESTADYRGRGELSVQLEDLLGVTLQCLVPRVKVAGPPGA